jgi:predicted metal-dependent hydrolase
MAALSITHLDTTAAALERGRELYAAGKFFEAHQAWEAAWRQEIGPMRRLLQGLIQAAGAYHKMAEHRHPLGMARLLELSLEQLEPLPDGFAGLKLARFREALAESRMEAYAWLAGAPAPGGPAPLATTVTATIRSLRDGPASPPA